jgi:beta-lactamase superfamily II metal-dependent hydrolase
MRGIPHFRRWPILFLVVARLGTAQANGKLQIHFIDVGQGDAAAIVSPLGEVVLIDNGVVEECDRPVAYLHSIDVERIDYHIASHYHPDHIGCTTEVLAAFPLQHEAYDRGFSYSSATYTSYVSAVGSHRQTATTSTVITLDEGGDAPVEISVVALNGNGVATVNENDLSLVVVLEYGYFRAVFGGDLSGVAGSDYLDIETSVAPEVGKVDVYKVHHHGSRYSTNTAWLTTTTPRVGIISVGNGNAFGHPTASCLGRLHAAKVQTYWTELGGGAWPEALFDQVAGSTVVEVAPGAEEFTVRLSEGAVDVYPTWARHRDRIRRPIRAEEPGTLHALGAIEWTPDQWSLEGGALRLLLAPE